MKTAIALIVPALLASAASAAEPAAARKPLRVLFVGNSYTGTNDLPSLIRALAAADGGARPVEVSGALRGGAQLQWHWTGKDRQGKSLRTHARAVIEKGAFDVVVIQEQSPMPVVDPASTVTYAALLCHAARKSGATPVLFMTWARKGTMKDPRPGRPPWTPQAMQAALAKAYIEAARQGGSQVAPVGLVWSAVRKAHPGLSLHKSDGSHPSIEGSYLAACVFHAVLTGRTPVGLPARLTDGVKGKSRVLADIRPGDAAVLQAAAWRVVREFRAKHPAAAPPKAPVK